MATLFKHGMGVMLIAVGGLIGLLSVAQAGVEVPKLPGNAKGATQCVENTDFMRRNHMDLLKHHRDDTMRLGIRTTKHSLKGCVECHASTKTGSVAASKDDFCVACHSYASVKLDCWGCHATKPAKSPVQSSAQKGAQKPAGHPSAMLGSTRAGGTNESAR